VAVFDASYLWKYKSQGAKCAVHIVHPEYWTKRDRNRPCGGSNPPHTKIEKYSKFQKLNQVWQAFGENVSRVLATERNTSIQKGL